MFRTLAALVIATAVSAVQIAPMEATQLAQIKATDPELDVRKVRQDFISINKDIKTLKRDVAMIKEVLGDAE